MSIWQKIKQFWLDCVEEQERVNLERAKKYPKIFGFQNQTKKSRSFLENGINPATGLSMSGGVDSGGNHYGYSSYNKNHYDD